MCTGCGAASAAPRNVSSDPKCVADDDGPAAGMPVPVASGLELSASERARHCSAPRDDVFARRR